MVSLSDRIRQKGEEIGFYAIGIAPAAVLLDEGSRLKDWLARGFHGEMSWMEREPEKRCDPRLLLPGARSIVVGVLNYYTPSEHAGSSLNGKISRYAWGDDYHDIVREKLTDLYDWIKYSEPHVEGKICVDTAPMMDKAWAVRAGLGWIGKHSNLITREIGSWVFIGSLILNIELDYEVQLVDDHCGTCIACLEACPTNAIVEPYVVDSRKCISYATIELRTEQIPSGVAENLNGWLYGCDICQDVCPWNRFEAPTEESRFGPRNNETEIDLNVVQEWTAEEYAERFKRSAVKRAKLPMLKRNAATLAANDPADQLT